MLKRGVLVLLLVTLFISSAYAEEHEVEIPAEGPVEDVVEDVIDLYDDIGDAELEASAGITPDSPFYFIEEAVENILVGDDPERALKYKEEKILEAREMIKKNKVGAATKAFERAEKYGDIVEREVSPEIEKQVRKSSKAIKQTFKELEGDLSGGDWEEVRELVQEHEEREDKIAASAKVSGQIKQLCETLAQLDPIEYARVCKTADDAPKWQRDLDKKLSEDQKKEAEDFFGIMSQCFRTSGRECKCDDISVAAFANKCSVMAPLAAKCDEGDESACEQMEQESGDIEDLLPDHLQDVLDDMDEEFSEAEFGNHMPRECKEAGANNPKDCMKIMFRQHAPPECIEALENGDIDFQSERKARKACEKIMFEQNAPPECREAGITDHRECGKLMFQTNAPLECRDAGLTGTERDDERRCREITRDLHQQGDEAYDDREGPRHGFGANCKSIEDPEDRLKCYDGVLSGGRQDSARSGPPGGWPQPCIEAGATDRRSCEAIMKEGIDFEEGYNQPVDYEQEFRKRYTDFQERRKETKDYEREFAADCREKGGSWDCSFADLTPGEPCRCFHEDGQEQRYDRSFEGAPGLKDGRDPRNERAQDRRFERGPDDGDFRRREGDFRDEAIAGRAFFPGENPDDWQDYGDRYDGPPFPDQPYDDDYDPRHEEPPYPDQPYDDDRDFPRHEEPPYQDQPYDNYDPRNDPPPYPDQPRDDDYPGHEEPPYQEQPRDDNYDKPPEDQRDHQDDEDYDQPQEQPQRDEPQQEPEPQPEPSPEPESNPEPSPESSPEPTGGATGNDFYRYYYR